VKSILDLLLVILLGIFIFLSIGSALRESLTYDEITDVEVGLRAWTEQKFNIEPYNPVIIRIITTAPLAIGIDAIIASDKTAVKIFPARLVTMLFGIGILLITHKIAKTFAGKNVALLSVYFLTFEPNLLANSHYVTHDVGATFFFLLAVYSEMQFLIYPSTRNTVQFGIFTGMAFAAKLTVIPYHFASGLLYLLLLKKRKSIIWISKNTKLLVLSILIMLLTIWSSYLFQWDLVIAPSNRPGRVSEKLLDNARSSGNLILENAIVFLQNQKLPLGSYLALIKNNILRTQMLTFTYFFGNFYSENKWYFTLVNVFLKTPIPMIAFLLVCFALGINKNKNNLTILFSIPIVAILLTNSLLKLNPYVRYSLPIFPFVAILSAIAVDKLIRRRLLLIIMPIFLWHSIGTLLSYPHFITYANEISTVFGKKYQILLDSNLDWGQGLQTLQYYLKDNSMQLNNLSYYGRDDPSEYGFKLNDLHGRDKHEELCKLHTVKNNTSSLRYYTAISVTGWYYCDYYKQPKYIARHIQDVIAESFLIF